MGPGIVLVCRKGKSARQCPATTYRSMVLIPWRLSLPALGRRVDAAFDGGVIHLPGHRHRRGGPPPGGRPTTISAIPPPSACRRRPPQEFFSPPPPSSKTRPFRPR